MGFVGVLLAGFGIVASSFLAQSARLDVERTVENESRTKVREEVQLRVEEKRSDLQARLDKVREEREARMQEVKDRIENARTQAEERRAELQERVQEIRDERRRATVLRVAQRFTDVNARWTAHWINVLSRLEDILVKLEQRDTEGLVASEIAGARSVLSNAKSAVEAQAGQVYEVSFDSEETLGADISSIVEVFKSDLRDTREIVQAAREAVVGALRAFQSSGDGVN